MTTMRLSKEDAANILDALNEWDETVWVSGGIGIGAKELNDDEVGLDYQRWVKLKLRLMENQDLPGTSTDETRDIAIRIMDYLIEKLGWEPEDEGDPGEWYPWAIQDEIHSIINKALGVKDEA